MGLPQSAPGDTRFFDRPVLYVGNDVAPIRPAQGRVPLQQEGRELPDALCICLRCFGPSRAARTGSHVSEPRSGVRFEVSVDQQNGMLDRRDRQCWGADALLHGSNVPRSSAQDVNPLHGFSLPLGGERPHEWAYSKRSTGIVSHSRSQEPLLGWKDRRWTSASSFYRG